MPATHLSLHYHLVFSTKNREPFISPAWRANLHAYLGGIVKGIKGVPLAIGGIDDHAHLLVGLRATHRLDYVLRNIKADSSGWVHKARLIQGFRTPLRYVLHPWLPSAAPIGAGQVTLQIRFYPH